MLDTAAPIYSAHVAVELLAFWGDSPVAEVNSGDSESASPELNSSGEAHETETFSAAWEHISLRQDGKRPLREMALVIAQWHDEPSVQIEDQIIPVDRHLKLYLTREETVLAHLVLEPAGDSPARPVYRLFRPQTAEALTQFLAAHGPEACFAVSMQTARPVQPNPTLPLRPAPAQDHAANL